MHYKNASNMIIFTTSEKNVFGEECYTLSIVSAFLLTYRRKYMNWYTIWNKILCLFITIRITQTKHIIKSLDLDLMKTSM